MANPEPLASGACRRPAVCRPPKTGWSSGAVATVLVRESLLLDSGVGGSNVVQEGPCFFKTIEKEGLQGGKGDENEAGQPQHIHDPGIPQEPSRFAGAALDAWRSTHV